MARGWNIHTLNILSALNKKPSINGIFISDLKFTVLDNTHVSYHDAQILAELHSIDESIPVNRYVAFRPERLAWHEVIVAVSTRVQTKNEEELHGVCFRIYEQLLDDLDTMQLDNVHHEIEGKVTFLVESYLKKESSVNDEYASQVFKICEKVEASNAKFGSYKEGYTTKLAMITYATDTLFTQSAIKALRVLVEKAIDADKMLSLIEMPEPEDRFTFLVSGGQASGKGSSVARLQELAKENGCEWDNVIKINGDSYKTLLLEPDTVLPELYSQLAYQESNVVKRKIVNRLDEMIKNKKAPHVFLDQVRVDPNAISQGLKNGGKVRGIILSVDVETAIERGYLRGLGARSRFEGTNDLLKCHLNVSLQTPDVLSQYHKQDVIFLLADNNVPIGEQARDVMLLDLKEGILELYSKADLDHFIKKIHINTNATSVDELYRDVPQTDYLDYLKPLLECGCTLNSVEEVNSLTNEDGMRHYRP
jgi:hypothetical protein